MSADDSPTLFADRPEWKDVTPLPQNDTMNPMAPIFYTAEYRDATDYFRAVVASGEMSPRVLELTENIIRQNPAHYSAWQYRYNTLLAIDADLTAERTLMDELAVKYLKTYQVWHHRRLLLTILKDPRPELDFIAEGLREDAKNYHTWAYRQWVLAHFDRPELWTGELGYVEEMLAKDVRNNSAWNHRFFVVWASGVREGEEDREEVLKRELRFTKDQIALAANNASAWNYLRGILEHTHTPFSSIESFVEPYTKPQSTAGSADMIDLDNPAPSRNTELPVVAAIEFMADIFEERGGESIQKAVPLWKSLADQHDAIRKKYWEYRIQDALKSQ